MHKQAIKLTHAYMKQHNLAVLIISHTVYCDFCVVLLYLQNSIAIIEQQSNHTHSNRIF